MQRDCMFVDKKSQYYQDVSSSNWIYGFNTVPIKIPPRHFVDIDKLILKLIRREKRPRTANSILKKNKGKGLTLPHFKTSYKATIIKTMWCW